MIMEKRVQQRGDKEMDTALMVMMVRNMAMMMAWVMVAVVEVMVVVK